MTYTAKQNAQRNRNRAVSQGRARAGFEWMQWEDNLITDDTRPDDVALAAKLARSVEAVELRRVALGRCDGTNALRRHGAVVTKRETARDAVMRLDPRMGALLYG